MFDPKDENRKGERNVHLVDERMVRNGSQVGTAAPAYGICKSAQKPTNAEPTNAKNGEACERSCLDPFVTKQFKDMLKLGSWEAGKLGSWEAGKLRTGPSCCSTGRRRRRASAGQPA